jgi:ribonucleotide reductase alpha subunit
MASLNMEVIKRNGAREPVSFDKITERITKQCAGLAVNSTALAQKVVAQLYNGVRTSELDELTAQIAANLSTTNPDYGVVASRIIISNHQKNTSPSFSATVKELASQVAPNGEPFSYVSDELLTIVDKWGSVIDERIDYERDFLLDYFGFKTMEKSYLLKNSKGVVRERPQHLWMRVSLALWAGSGHACADADALDRAFQTYDMMSTKRFTHATPTLFNAGTPHQQLSSCFLLSMDSDAIKGIYKTLGDCAVISKHAGGIGLHCSNIRAKGSIIRGTNGKSNGLVPMLRVFNNTARYVDQGGGKRNGSFAIYLEPWHADIEDFLRLKLNGGAEEERARDLFYALWVPDLFMRRVEEGGTWTLFCPDEAPGLADCYGAEFDQLYERYEREGKGRRVVEAQKLWFQILDTQIETGTPYLCYKDAANSKSNQQNLGVIKSSNLCVAPETLVLTDAGEFPIVELEGKTVNVWNGKQWSATTVVKTGTDQRIIGVDILVGTVGDNGSYKFTLKHLECTDYHKFLVEAENDGPSTIKYCRRIQAKDLKRGTNLRSWSGPDGEVHEAIVWATYDYGRTTDTYCFNEPLNHAGVFNGILTGNCSEIIEYTDKNETAVCNLASMALPSYVDKATRTFDYDGFRKAVAVAVRNLNRVIDINYYPTPETRTSNMRHRPIGLGVQGLADVFALMRLSWESPEAARTNQLIFEHMYYAAVEASHEAAMNDTGSYSSFEGSPAHQGRLQPDLWGITPITEREGTLDWRTLRQKASLALANSLLIAPMPTASTSQILGFNECFEAFTTNIYTRRTLAGEFILVNKYLVAELAELGLWSEEMKQVIIAYNGSIQDIEAIPQDVRERYKTVWEIKQKTLIDMAAARGAFVCQSQSLNLFVSDPTYSKLTSMHFYAWKKGLKTGLYYLRTKAGVQAQKFTIDPKLLASIGSNAKKEEKKKESRQEMLDRLAREYEEEQAQGCTMCSG